MLKEFKEFMIRGNVIDMAVGVVIGTAFTAIVTSFVTGVITPLVGLVLKAITGTASTKFDGLNVTINGVVFEFGLVFTAIFTFLITGLVLFFVIKSINKLRNIGKPQEEEEAVAIHTELDYLKEIRDLLAKGSENDMEE